MHSLWYRMTVYLCVTMLLLVRGDSVVTCSYHWSKYTSVVMISAGIAIATVASTDCVVNIFICILLMTFAQLISISSMLYVWQILVLIKGTETEVHCQHLKENVMEGRAMKITNKEDCIEVHTRAELVCHLHSMSCDLVELLMIKAS